MKIKVSVELDIPDPKDENVDLGAEYAKGITWADAFILQLVFDEFVNYAVVSHLEDAADWAARSNGDKGSTEYQILTHHRLWADILQKAEKTMKIERVP